MTIGRALDTRVLQTEEKIEERQCWTQKTSKIVEKGVEQLSRFTQLAIQVV